LGCPQTVEARARIDHRSCGLQSATGLGFCGDRLKGGAYNDQGGQGHCLEGPPDPLRHAPAPEGV